MVRERGQKQGPNFGWLLLVYRVPSEPSNNRVSIWRDLKRHGVLYLQQCVCVLPRRRELKKALLDVRDKIASVGGSSNLFEIPHLAQQEEETLMAGFRDLTSKQYEEIVEECETKFIKEIEFEHFRKNYSFAEAEEISEDLEKIRGWFQRIQAHDWFSASGREKVEDWIRRCEIALEDFYSAVHAHSTEHASGPDAAELEHEIAQMNLLPAASEMLLPVSSENSTEVLSVEHRKSKKHS